MADLTIETAISTKNLLPVELTIHDHYARVRRCALHKLPAVLGRDDGADVQLMDPWVSHRHCEIHQSGNVLVVRDLDSRTGFSCAATGSVNRRFYRENDLPFRGPKSSCVTLERRERRLKPRPASRQSKSHRRSRSRTHGNFFSDQGDLNAGYSALPHVTIREFGRRVFFRRVFEGQDDSFLFLLQRDGSIEATTWNEQPYCLCPVAA